MLPLTGNYNFLFIFISRRNHFLIYEMYKIIKKCFLLLQEKNHGNNILYIIRVLTEQGHGQK